MDAPDAAAVIAEAEAKRRRGDMLEAFDVVMRARAAQVEDPVLDYLSVRLLVELGDVDGALRRYGELGLGASGDVDHAALKGRILKDKAFLLHGAARQRAMAEAAEVYAEVYRASADAYPGINAATLLFLAGRVGEAQAIARTILALPAIQMADNYWDCATGLEASLLVGDESGAHRYLDRAVAAPGGAPSDRASTIRQIRRLGASDRIDSHLAAMIAAALRPAPVMVYCGHMFREGSDAEAALAARIGDALDDIAPIAVYGPLACGADILIAEAVLARGGELNVVLPFRVDDFLEQSVLPGGKSWAARFQACLDAAEDVVLATESAYVGDDNQFAYGTHIAMGLAEIRARQLETESVQLAIVRDGDAEAPRSTIAGTHADIAIWEGLGRTSRLVPAGAVDRNLDFPPHDNPAPDLERGAYSILFADYAGFSKFGERELPCFANEVMAPIGEVLDGFGDDILFRNTWGDALYAVISRPEIAARVALALQARLAEPPPGLWSDSGDADGQVGMRIGVHHGPIYKGYDRVVGQPLWFGTEVTRTARIEPVTPTGAVYCTEAFAAMLALCDSDEFTQNYVGRVALAKGYGQLAMYRLLRL